MIKELLTYPDTRIRHVSPDIRIFDKDLVEIIDNMKDTMLANSLDALNSIQIAMPANIVLIKNKDGSYLELINARILTKNGSITEEEKTHYYGDLLVRVKRYEQVKILYQDRNGEQHSLDADGALSRTLQRKIDYNYGSTFFDKLDKKERILMEKSLEYGVVESNGTCPTVFYRDYFINAIKGLLLICFLALFSPLFVDLPLRETLYTATQLMALLSVMLIAGYYFYADYEVKKYKSCTSCQSANTLANAAIYFVLTLLLFIGSYLFIKP